MGRFRNTVAIAPAITVSLAPHAAAQESPSKNLSCTQSSGHHIHMDKRTCPLGGKTYEALTLGTYSTYGSTLSLTANSYLQFPIAVPVCPSNGFVDFKSNYTEEELDALTQTVESKAYQTLRESPHTSWGLFSAVMQGAKLEGYDQWWIDNQAAEEAANCAHDLYTSAAQRAITSAEAALTADPEGDAAWPLRLTIANFHRRLGDFEAAQSYADALPEIPEDWAGAFNTLNEAIDLKLTEKVAIGQFEKERARRKKR